MTTAATQAPSAAPVRPKGPKSKQQLDYEKKMGDLDVRIAYLKARVGDLRGTGYTGGHAVEGSPKAKLIAELKKLRDQSRPLQDERRSWAKEAADLREVLKKRSGELKDAKDKLAFKTVPEIEAQIAQYETQLETNSFKLSEEKQIVSEISKLNKAKRTLSSLDESNNVLGLKARSDAIWEKIKARDVLLDGLRSQIEAASAKLDELNGIRTAERVSKEERQAQLDKLNGELREAYETRSKTYEENKASRAAAFEARIKRDARFKEERRCQEIDEKIADLEERLLGCNSETMLDKKLAECNNMIAYFTDLSKGEKPVEAARVSALLAPVGRTVEPLADAVVIKKKDDDVFFMGAGAKKKGPKKAAAEGAAVSHTSLGKLPMHVLAGLTGLSLAIPSSTDQLPILLAALRQIQAAIVDKKAELEASGATQAVDPKMQAILDELAKLKLERDTKPVEGAEEAAAAGSAVTATTTANAAA